jgi:elongation factor G
MTRRSQSLERIRNFGIIAHVDAGKTTLTERVLLYTGRIHAMGEVHDGTAHTDSHALEQQKGITILAAAVTCDWQGHRFHLIDTPGHVDFTIEVERSLRVLDGAVVVLDAVAGVEPQTETVWRQADRHHVPRVVFVNKLDRPGADLDMCLRQLEKRLAARPVRVNLPVLEGGALVGVVDVLEEQLVRWTSDDGQSFTVGPVPASFSDNLEAARAHLLEVCADEDPAILEAVVHGAAVDTTALRTALRKATLAGRAVPVLVGSALRNRGVQPLLDAVVAYLPSPRDRGGVDGALSALAFKVSFDEHGAMSFVRVYAGALEKGQAVVLAGSGKSLRVGRLVQLIADRREDVERLSAGEIGAVLGTPIAGGETLCDPAHVVALERIVAPEPVVQVALEPVARDDRDRLPLALSRMIAADPSLRLSTCGETGATLLAGMGQLHLDIAVERLAGEHGVRVVAGQPRVAYRSTLRATGRVEYRHVKQSGGPGQFAVVVLEVAPAERGAGLVFVDATRGGVVPASYAAAVEDGVREAMQRGFDHPLVDVAVTLVDGAIHAKDSSELAFKIAGERGFKAAAEQAGVVVLEPVARLEVSCPDSDVGVVVGDIGRRRGQVLGLQPRGEDRVVSAELPLAESFGYAGSLSSMTHGRGRFVLTPERYQVVAG